MAKDVEAPKVVCRFLDVDYDGFVSARAVPAGGAA